MSILFAHLSAHAPTNALEPQGFCFACEQVKPQSNGQWSRRPLALMLVSTDRRRRQSCGLHPSMLAML
jgi:hypothetical protein